MRGEMFAARSGFPLTETALMRGEKSFGEKLKMARRLFLTLAYALLNYSSTANYC